GGSWEASPLFTRFRVPAWMPDPCRSCERRAVVYGGCRGQALLLTGDPAHTGPACHLPPDHGLVEAAVRAANDPERPGELALTPRPDPRSGARGAVAPASAEPGA